jgi:tryptophan-rich sensory protein
MFRKPFWTPPLRVFAPVLTILYIAMAVVAWRVWVGIKKKWEGVDSNPIGAVLFAIGTQFTLVGSVFWFSGSGGCKHRECRSFRGNYHDHPVLHKD